MADDSQKIIRDGDDLTPISAKELEPIARFIARYEELHYQSPLPPPQILALYRSIDPEIVPFILRSAEREMEHRHHIEKAESAQSDKGIISARWLVLAGFAVGALALALGHDAVAGTIATVPVFAIVAINILGTGSAKHSFAEYVRALTGGKPATDENTDQDDSRQY